MKSIILLFMFLGTVAFGLAQDCKGYLYMTTDAEAEMTIFDAKGKENGKQEWKVDGVKKDGAVWTASVKTKFTDKKGKEGSKSQGQYKCDAGVLKADIKMSLPQEPMEAYKDMEVKADEVYIEYPGNMSAGQTLTDANFKMEAYNNGAIAATITFKEMNRKVDGKESVTTPAGTWEAYKISYDSQFRIEIGKTGIGIPMNFKVNEWFAPGFGVVKSETYNKNGKLLGSSQITSLKK